MRFKLFSISDRNFLLSESFEKVEKYKFNFCNRGLLHGEFYIYRAHNTRSNRRHYELTNTRNQSIPSSSW